MYERIKRIRDMWGAVVRNVGLIGELGLSGETNLRSSIVIPKLKPTCGQGKRIVIRAQAEEKE
jgi:hypothetical protein